MTLVLPQPFSMESLTVDHHPLASARSGRPCTLTSYSSATTTDNKEQDFTTLRDNKNLFKMHKTDSLDNGITVLSPLPCHKRQSSSSSAAEEDSSEDSRRDQGKDTENSEADIAVKDFYRGPPLRYNTINHRRPNKRYSSKNLSTTYAPKTPYISAYQSYGQVSYYYEPSFPDNLCYQVTPNGTICYVPVMDYYNPSQARLRSIANCARSAVQNYINNSNLNATHEQVNTTSPRSSFSDSAFDENSSSSRCSSTRSSTLSRHDDIMPMYKALLGKGFLTFPKSAIPRSLKHTLIKRSWVKMGNAPIVSSPLENSDEFTVMCYNVLSEKYATGSIYTYCPDWALRWSYRKLKILEEILKYGADIICLQEVENDQFNNFFTPKLKKHGFNGIFYPKSRWSYYNEDERKTVDGCCIFYRTNKFNLVREKMTELNKLPFHGQQNGDPLIHRLTNRDNIGILTLFEYSKRTTSSSYEKKYLVVSTAHFFWDPAFSDVKILQSIILIDAIKKFVNECMQSQAFQGKNPIQTINDMPIVLCGDLNSLPDSGAIEFLKNGQVKLSHPEFLKLGSVIENMVDKVDEKSQMYESRHMSHDLDLTTPYNDSIIPFTNYTLDFRGSIDHMFHSKNLLKPTRVLGPIDPEWFNSNQIWGAPNPAIPSDHIPLVTTYQFNSTQPNVPIVANSTMENGDKLLYSSLFKHEIGTGSKDVKQRTRAVSQSEVEIVARREIINTFGKFKVPSEQQETLIQNNPSSLELKPKLNNIKNYKTNTQKAVKSKKENDSCCSEQANPIILIPKNTARRKKNRRAAAKRKLTQQLLELEVAHSTDKETRSDSTVPNSLCSSSLASSSLSLDQQLSLENLVKPGGYVKHHFGQTYPSSDEDDYSNYHSVSSNFQSENTDDDRAL